MNSLAKENYVLYVLCMHMLVCAVFFYYATLDKHVAALLNLF